MSQPNPTEVRNVVSQSCRDRLDFAASEGSLDPSRVDTMHSDAMKSYDSRVESFDSVRSAILED